MMEAAMAAGEMIYEGPEGYVTLKRTEHNGKQGALLYYANPDARKLHAVDVQGMCEMEDAVTALEQEAGALDFCVFYGAYDQVHAGADITQFAGDPDYAAIKKHLDRGTLLDVRVKKLWTKMRTVAILAGDRYGGSVEWPLFAEWAVACDKARLQFSEVHLGIVPGWNGILNVLLKSNALNGKYMGQTGNPVAAPELVKMGLAQAIVATPTPPDRRTVERDKWPALWAEHAVVSQGMLMDAALKLATTEAEPVRETGFVLASEEDLAAEVARRIDPMPYVELRDEIAAKLAALGAEPGKDELKALTKEVNKSLGALGKPLAPASVNGLAEYVARWGALGRDELVANFKEAGMAEASLCDELMHAEHRRAGIAAILSRNPAERVPVFD
jgi:enoyl-CoA hydratase/carnithine racemase